LVPQKLESACVAGAAVEKRQRAAAVQDAGAPLVRSQNLITSHGVFENALNVWGFFLSTKKRPQVSAGV
jgi:hypothetical protein